MLAGGWFGRAKTRKKIVWLTWPLLIALWIVCPQLAFALDKVNVTLPSKSFQFIIFPLAKERGYMKEEGVDLNIVVMASTRGLPAQHSKTHRVRRWNAATSRGKPRAAPSSG